MVIVQKAMRMKHHKVTQVLPADKQPGITTNYAHIGLNLCANFPSVSMQEVKFSVLSSGILSNYHFLGQE